jgi:RNA polymerase sigma-70 factor (ECF subfamily)
MKSEPAAEFDTVFRDSFPTIVRAAWLIVGDWEVARELAQDAFVEALIRWKRITEYDQPGAWIRRVAINKALNAKRRKPAPLRPIDVAPAADHADLDLLAALDELTAPQRAAVVLHHLWDLPVDEVAQMMDCAPGTVKSHLSRGRSHLASVLGERSAGDSVAAEDDHVSTDSAPRPTDREVSDEVG